MSYTVAYKYTEHSYNKKSLVIRSYGRREARTRVTDVYMKQQPSDASSGGQHGGRGGLRTAKHDKTFFKPD